jgi:predicted dienelactone hydrolase
VPARRTRRAGTVATAIAVAATLAGCGSAVQTPVRPGDPASRAGSACPPLARDLAAPGPFRVGRRSAVVARRDSAGARRHIDPTAWFPRSPAGAARRCPLGLILFSHGVNGAPRNYSQLLAHLASQGFVVLAPHHPDARAGGADEAAERVADLTYLLDHWPSLGRRLVGGLARRVSARRVGAAGHSFGGHSVADLAATDGRVKAVVVMAAGTDPATAARVTAPTLALAGAADTLVPVSRVRGFEQALPSSTPHGLLVIAHAGHGAYGDTCVAARTCDIVERPASALFLTYLAGRRDAAAPLDPRRVHDPRVTLTTVGMPPR